MRQCGECFACCTAAEVRFETYTKPSRKTCLHVLPSNPKQNGRCDIFGQDCRPSACRQFECSWKQGLISDNYRPDLTGVMLSLNNMNGGVWGFAIELEYGALLGKGASSVIEFVRALQVPVIVASYQRLPPNDTGDCVVVKDTLLPRSKKLLGSELASLSDDIKIYQLFDQNKGGIA